jgi:hypothetical protein
MSEEDVAVRARIIAESPACRICGWPCVAGQTDKHGARDGSSANLTCKPDTTTRQHVNANLLAAICRQLA